MKLIDGRCSKLPRERRGELSMAFQRREMRRAVDGVAVATIESYPCVHAPARAFSIVARATPDRFIVSFPALKRHAQLMRRAAAAGLGAGVETLDARVGTAYSQVGTVRAGVDTAFPHVDMAFPRVDTAFPRVDIAFPRVSTLCPHMSMAFPREEIAFPCVGMVCPQVEIACARVGMLGAGGG